MFVWRADAVLNELAIHLPETYAGLEKIAAAWGTPNQESTVNTIYPKLKKISVDYAIMEPASQNKGKAQVAVGKTISQVNIASQATIHSATTPNPKSEFVVTFGNSVTVEGLRQRKN